MASPVLLVALLSSIVGVVYVYLYVGRREKNLPPGPPTIPVLGNLHQLPLKGIHFILTEWAREYGGLYTLKLGTGTAAVITDRRVVKELLDKKSSKSSERPKSYVASLISGGDHILLMNYDARWRDIRKLMHGTFMERVVDGEHLKVQEAEARQMLRDYLMEPESHMLHPKRFSNSVAMSLVWGVRTPSASTRHMTRLYALMDVWGKVMETGATPPVDIYPLLHWLPQSFFLNWRNRANHVRQEMNHLYADFLSDIRARRANPLIGDRGSFMDKVLSEASSQKRMPQLTYTDHELYFMGGTITEGGSDTSAGTIIAFVHAMTAFSDVAAIAQREIDSVVGADRSPTWADYVKLPYVAACVKESIRWRPIGGLGFPHALAEDEWVDGKFLPKGTVLLVNIWGLHHDPVRFPNPDVFDPDHFKDVKALAPELANGPWEKRDHYIYGFGRRFCPGVHVAERNLFLAIAKLLWAFTIGPGKDPEGMVVTPDTDPQTGYSEGFLVCAKDFGAEFTIRDEERQKTILREFEEAGGVFARFQASEDDVA